MSEERTKLLGLLALLAIPLVLIGVIEVCRILMGWNPILGAILITAMFGLVLRQKW